MNLEGLRQANRHEGEMTAYANVLEYMPTVGVSDNWHYDSLSFKSFLFFWLLKRVAVREERITLLSPLRFYF